jgi:hypothetical protein
MALAFSKGEAVRQVVPVIAGTVVDMILADGEVLYLVAYTDADGNAQQRYFKEHEIAAAV